MNWTKQAYLNTSDIIGQKTQSNNEIWYSFDAVTGNTNNRELRFYSASTKAVINIDVAASFANTVTVTINGKPAGEFTSLSFVLNVWLTEGINIIELNTTGTDYGMLVKIKGTKLERIYSPIEVIGSAQFGDGCLIYTKEDGSLIRRMVTASGEMSREKMFGYIGYDTKYKYSVEGEKIGLISAGITENGVLKYTDTTETILDNNVRKASICENIFGGVNVLYVKEDMLSLVMINTFGEKTYYTNIINNVEDLVAAVSGNVFFYKINGRWWSGEFAKFDNGRFEKCICLGEGLPENGDLFIKLTALNTVNRPNAAYEDGSTAYYICREGNIYRYCNKEKSVVAYCEYYIPYKTGGIMVWSKKICACPTVEK